MKNISKKTLICTAISAAAVALIIVVIMAVCGKYTDNDNETNKADNTNKTESVISTNNAESDNTGSEVEKDSNAGTESKDENNGSDAVSEERVDGPTFLYIVSKQDDDYETYMKSVDKLKEEYKGKVNFSIGDINENEQMKMIMGESADTPCLIMTNKDGASVAIEYNCTDEARMKADIELALEK